MIKVMIADDHPIVRKGLKEILNDEPDIFVSIEAASGDEALQNIRSDNWDVLLLDIAMPGKNVLELIKLSKLNNPKKPILVFSMYPAEQYAVRMMRAGADGYLGKESDPDILISAIQKLAQGGKYISNSMSEIMVSELQLNNDKLKHTLLTDREFQVFMAIARCKRIADIATEMSLSAKTVSTFKNRILKKMYLTNNSEIIYYALEHKLI